MEYNYYIFNYDGQNRIYRINKEGRIYKNVDSMEVLIDNKWVKNSKAIKSFMHYNVTGWIDEDDAMDYETAVKKLKNE